MIKICGITCWEDARRSIDLGATALGFNLYPKSLRFLSPKTAADLVGRIPKGVLSVAVVVGLPDPDSLRPFEAVQIHGLTNETEIPELRQRVMVAATPESMHSFPDSEIVIDASWGRGLLADWDQLHGVSRSFILSGGLSPENVSRAIHRLKPAGVDVCSGVELAPGKKDPRKLEHFIKRALVAFSEVATGGGSREEL